MEPTERTDDPTELAWTEYLRGHAELEDSTAQFVAHVSFRDGYRAAINDRPPVPEALMPQENGPERLTAREFEVLRLLVEGRGTTREIANALTVTRATARTHVQHVMEKAGVHSRLEVVAWARDLVRLADRGPIEAAS